MCLILYFVYSGNFILKNVFIVLHRVPVSAQGKTGGWFTALLAEDTIPIHRKVSNWG